MAVITAATCRAARGLADMTQKQLAEAASVGLSTVKAFEAGASVPVLNNLRAIQSALEAAGVEFIPENGGGAGVRLKTGDLAECLACLNAAALLTDRGAALASASRCIDAYLAALRHTTKLAEARDRLVDAFRGQAPNTTITQDIIDFIAMPPSS